MLMQQEREELIRAGRLLFARGMVQLSGGNLSIRDAGTKLVAIKPSGVPYVDMRPQDVVIVDLEGTVVEGERRPSIETPVHIAVYKARPDVGAVVHCHPAAAIAWSLKRSYIPAVTISQYVTNGAIVVVPYREPGSRELAVICVKTLGKDAAVVLQGHGVVACGKDMNSALEAAFVTEDAARIAILAESIPGEPFSLDDAIGRMIGADVKSKLAGLE